MTITGYALPSLYYWSMMKEVKHVLRILLSRRNLPCLFIRRAVLRFSRYQTEYSSLISQNDVWSRGFCHVLLKDTPVKDLSSYQFWVDLNSKMDWSWDRIAFVGIVFNARDINNAGFICFR